MNNKSMSLKDLKRLHQFGKTMLLGHIHGPRPAADWEDTENHSAGNIHIKRFKSQEVGSIIKENTLSHALVELAHKQRHVAPRTLRHTQLQKRRR